MFWLDPRHARRWDPIAKTHLESRFLATSYFDLRERWCALGWTGLRPVRLGVDQVVRRVPGRVIGAWC